VNLSEAIRRQLDEDNGVRILVHRLLLEDVLAENQQLRDDLQEIADYLAQERWKPSERIKAALDRARAALAAVRVEER
jgi:hypothetical protein